MWIHRYFEAPEAYAEPERLSVQDAVAEYRRLLEDSVRLRLVSDVPFGAFLSGGVDSSAIVALMSGMLREPVRTYSVGFAGQGVGELPAAREVATHLGTQHREIVISPEDIIRNIAPAIAALDGPVSEPATIPLLLLSRAAAQDVKMVLSGEGADEFLGGYTKHSLERFSGAFRSAPLVLRRAMRAGIAALPRSLSEKPLRAIDALGEKDPRRRYPLWFAAFGGSQFDALYRSDSLDLDSVADWPAAARRGMRGLLLFDQTSWLPDNLLERGDRMSMAASIEARMPFMDQELAAFTARVPVSLRIRGWTGKWLLRRAIRDLLPREIFTRRKRGFPVPLAAWFRGSLHGEMRETILDSGGPAVRLLGREPVEQMVDGHRTGAVDATKALWLLFNLNRFCDAYQLRA
jgi:asparagine synthase (glutamine-hydrolysing)